MAGLMDSINQQLGSAPTPAVSTGATGQVSGLLRAKLGKANEDTSAPTQSNIGEQQAQQTTNLGLKQIGSANKIAGQQLGEQTADVQQRADIQQAQHQQQLTSLQVDYAKKAQTVVDSLAANASQLSAEKKQAQMEQAGFLIRGSNQNYIQELQRQGQLNRLTDKTGFQQETVQAVMGAEGDLFKNNLQFQTLINANQRDFDSALQGMSENFALNMGHMAVQGMNAATTFSAASGILGAGVGATETYMNSNRNTTPGAGQGGESTAAGEDASNSSLLQPSSSGALS